jgi:DNA-binding CsgD family transcriptional regulator
MAQVFAISINGSSLIPSQFALWAVKAMRQKQRTEDEKVVYLSCPCSELLQEIKAVLQQAGFVVIYALETPPEDAIVIYVHCPLTEREREILQAILSTGSVKSAAAKLGLSINTVHKHLRQMLASFNVRSTLQLIAIALQKGFIRWEDEPSAEPRSRLVHQRGNFPSAMWDRKITLKGE